MKRYALLFSSIFLLLLSHGTQAEVEAVIAGDWEFDILYDLVGLPQSFPGYTTTQCISDEVPFPSISRPGNECQMQLQGHFGNTYTWTLDCSDDWEMVQGMGRIHYDNGEAKGDVYLQILNPHNSPQMMVFEISGRRKGPCNR
jgi:hypothetical protein